MNNRRVYKHLRPADYLLVFLPIVLATILFLIIPVIWFAIEQLHGNTGGIGGFDFTGLVVFAGAFVWMIFCGAYFLLALVLSLLTQRNMDFRVLLVTISILIGIGFYILFLR